MNISKNLLWLISASLSRTWSFSHQINLVSRTLRRRGFNIIFLSANSTHARIDSIVRRKSRAIIMMHGYPRMFPFLFEENTLHVPVFLWAQVSSSAIARRYNEIKIKDLYLIPITPVSKQFFESSGYPRVLEVIPHMVDVRTFRPISPGLKDNLKASLGIKGKFIFGKVAVNSSRKRLKDLITVYAEIKNKARNSALVLKTKRVSLEGEDLDKLVKSLGLEGEVIFIEDYLSPARLNQIYNIFDLYCHVSEWEGFGLTVAEAMAAKVPVLAHATQGPGEYLPYKEFLVPSAGIEMVGECEVGLVDREKFKEKMLLAYENREILKEFGMQGHDYVRENLSPKVIADKFERILKTGT